MKKIYKYTLQTLNEQELELPADCKILSVAEQNNSIVLYALVEPENKLQSYKILIRGTGHSADDVAYCPFLGTVNLMNGTFMFHVFWKANFDIENKKGDLNGGRT